MWVFGYGSLMWDGWESTWGCVRRVQAKVPGYCRMFNKASIRNWGTKTCPCPTLNLVKSDSTHCRGVAFEFPDDRKQEILSYLTEREGRDFVLRKLPAQLDGGDEIEAIVPIYEGKNLIRADSVDKIAKMVLQANGKNGSCVSYVKGILDKLCSLEIDDSAVTELWKTVAQSGRKPRAF